MAVNLRKYIPIHINRRTYSEMERQDKKRAKAKDALNNKDKLIAIAQEGEGLLFEFEVKMSAASQVLDPRPALRNGDTKATSSNG